MKTLANVMLVGILLIGGASFAADGEIKAPKTRAAIRQEAIDARAKGEVTAGEDPLYPSRHATPAARPLKRKSPKVLHPSRAKEVNAGRLPDDVIST